MKKLVIATFAVVLLPALVFAQGTINFASTSANQYFQLPDNSKAPVGTIGTLWWSPDNVMSYTPIGTNITVNASGYLTTPTTATTPAGTAAGASAWFYVQGAIAGVGTGKSPNFNQATGGGGTPPSPPAGLTGWTAPITVSAVPEPSVIALAGLGVASLLLFRRRN